MLVSHEIAAAELINLFPVPGLISILSPYIYSLLCRRCDVPAPFVDTVQALHPIVTVYGVPDAPGLGAACIKTAAKTASALFILVLTKCILICRSVTQRAGYGRCRGTDGPWSPPQAPCLIAFLW